jgi:peptide/nickel transport system permease protein
MRNQQQRAESDIEEIPTGVQPGLPAQAPPEPAGQPAAPVVDVALSTRQLAWRRFKHHKVAIVSAIILAVIALMCIFAPLIARYGPTDNDLLAPLQGPSLKHWLGTDNLGRDEFSRILYGGRISLLVGLAVALSAGGFGAFVGALAGYYGGWRDNLLMRFTDLFLSIPFLVILIVAARLPAIANLGVLGIVIILALFFWMPDARIVRGVFLSLKEKEFVEAARASGASNKRIIFVHMIPNAMGPIIVNTTLNVAAAILTESALSFLGFGIQPPTPSWGNLLNDAQNFTLISPGLVWFPGLAILLTVLCVNFLGDGLRDALDPHQKIGVG